MTTNVYPISSVKGDDIPGDHQGRHRDHDVSMADCNCLDMRSALSGFACPACQSEVYTLGFGAKHKGASA